MRSFLLCLAPAVVACLLMVMATEAMFDAAVILIVMGSAISGSCAAFYVYGTMEPKGRATFSKWGAAIATFLGVAPLYFFLAVAGCSGVVAVF